MATGLTFGTISALFGLQNKIIEKAILDPGHGGHPECIRADAHRPTIFPTHA